MFEDDDTLVLDFAPTQEARHAAILRINEMARALVDRVRAKAAGQPADDDGVLPEPDHLRLTLGVVEDDITAKQRGFLHAAVFPQIAEQYTFPDGARYHWRIWKEFYRERFLGYRWVMRKAVRWDAKLGAMVQAKRATPHRERVSTEDLSIKQYSAYIDRVIDTAVVELGVKFEFRPEEREAVRYNRPERAKKEAVAA